MSQLDCQTQEKLIKLYQLKIKAVKTKIYHKVTKYHRTSQWLMILKQMKGKHLTTIKNSLFLNTQEREEFSKEFYLRGKSKCKMEIFFQMHKVNQWVVAKIQKLQYIAVSVASILDRSVFRTYARVSMKY